MGWDLWGGLSSAWNTSADFVANNWQTAAGIVVGAGVTAVAIAAAPEEATAAAAAAVYVGAGALGGMASVATEDVLNGRNPLGDGKRIMTAGVVSGALTLATLGVGSQYTRPIVDSLVGPEAGAEAGQTAAVVADAMTTDAAQVAKGPVAPAVEQATPAEAEVAMLEKEPAPNACRETACDSGEPGGNCFVAGTLVLTPSGPRPIEAVHEGDTVLAASRADERSWHRVVRTFHHTAAALATVTFAHEGAHSAIRCTLRHPWFVKGHGWVAAGALRAGDELVAASGDALVVEDVAVARTPSPTFNFEVESAHTYFVEDRPGVLAALVHNACNEIAPDVFESRGAAFEQIKKDLKIPDSAQPRTFEEPLTDKWGNRILDENNQPIMSRVYEYTRPDGSKVYIQDHGAGHQFGEGGVGDQGPHFNVRPEDPENPGFPLRNGSVEGMRDHYGWPETTPTSKGFLSPLGGISR